MKKRLIDAAIVAATLGLIVGSTAVARADAYGELFHWVDWMAQKYGMGTVYVDEAYMAPGTYGASRGRTIVFNKSYTDDPARLQAEMVDDVAHGFHPGLRCTATQILAAHESAHVLDFITGYSARYELAEALRNGLSGEVSGYSFDTDGSVDAGEALADAMVAVECDTPSPAESALYGMLTS